MSSPHNFINISTLRQYEKEGKLKSQRHPVHPLTIWNYTSLVQFRKEWDDITMQCRGLVTDDAGRIWALPPRKFFNAEEWTETDWAAVRGMKFETFEKLDGSLGLWFYYTPVDEWIFASRGSFTSPQAQEGMRMMDELYPFARALDKRRTYVFEIIYPENRIVVDYGDARKLVYLMSFWTESGEEVGGCDSYPPGFECVQSLETGRDGDWTGLKARNVPNAEGYVLRFTNGTRVKVKFETYIQLHRVVDNLKPSTVVDWYREGKTREECLERVPDEWMAWFRGVWEKIDAAYWEVFEEIRNAYVQAITETRAMLEDETKFRAVFARTISLLPNKPVLFAMLDGKPDSVIRELIFKHTDVASAVDNDAISSLQKPNSTPNHKRQQPPASPLSTLILTVGVSGSGKSSWAAHLQAHSNPGSVIILSRDAIRRMYLGLETDTQLMYYYGQSPKLLAASEAKVTRWLEDALRESLDNSGRVIIVDNTHLKLKYLVRLVQIARESAAVRLNWKVRVFDLPATLDEQAARVAGRVYNNRIGRDVLAKQREAFEALMAKGHPDTQVLDAIAATVVGESLGNVITQNPALPPCVIYDLDGTLAHMNGRSPYDTSERVEEDELDEEIARLLRLEAAPSVGDVKCASDVYQLRSGKRVIICTGRSQAAEAPTRRWLAKHFIPFAEIHFRPIGNTEPDWKVKEAMWRDISTRFWIQHMVDDRDQVVKHARRCGFKVLQVAEGNF